MKRIVIAATLLAATLTTAHAQEGQPLDARERAYRRSFPDWEAREARDAVIREQAAKQKSEREARRAADEARRKIEQQQELERQQAQATERERQQELERQQQQAQAAERERQEREFEAQRPAREAAEQQATIEAARQEALRLMKEQMRATEEAKRAQPAAPAPAKPPAATTAHAEGDVVVSTPVQACAKVTTECRELAVGTVVVEQNYWGNTSCVLPAGAAPPCLWVNVNALTYPKGYQPVRMTQEQMDQNQKDRRYAGGPPTPGVAPNRLQIQFQRGASNGSYTESLCRCGIPLASTLRK